MGRPEGAIELSRVLKDSRALGAKIDALSSDSAGLLPTSIWESLFRITHICPTLEVVIAVYSDAGKFLGWALKQRDVDDCNWPELFHAPGTVLRHHDSPESIRKRLDLEIFGEPAAAPLRELPCVIRPDPVRDVTCLSIVYLLSIPDERLSTLSGTWHMFTHQEILSADPRTIVDQIPLYIRAYEHLADRSEKN